MKNFKSLFAALILGMFLFSCNSDDNDEIIVEPEDEFDARLNNTSTDSLTSTVFLNDIDDGVVDVLLKFNSPNVTMNRVYITRNVQGQGAEAVDAGEEFGVDAKGDGSIDLSGDLRSSFQFDLDFSTAGLAGQEGTIVYQFWATTAKGDFRDPTNDIAAGPATLTINLSGTNPAKILKESTQVIRLEAPLGDASSETFISTLDLEIYQISEGEEFAAFWDFGYYYGASGLASFASTARYPQLFTDPDNGTSLVSVIEFLDIEATEVNNTYFRLAPDGTDFDAFMTAGDLSFTIDEMDDERINQLEVGDIVYLLDQYGKKGVIKITDLEPGFNAGDYIEFDIKMER